MRYLLLVCLLLQGPASAQVEGTVLYLGPSLHKVILLQPGGAVAYFVDTATMDKFLRTGLAWRWRVFPSKDNRINSALALGPEPAVRDALATFTRFAQLINGRQYPAAYSLQSANRRNQEPLEIFVQVNAKRRFSSSPDDLRVREFTKDRVLIRARLAGGDIVHFPLTWRDGRWSLDGYEISHEDSPADF